MQQGNLVTLPYGTDHTSSKQTWLKKTKHAAYVTCQRIWAVIFKGSMLLPAVLIAVACTCVLEIAKLWH